MSMVSLPMTFVKICGLQEPAHARAAAIHGADLLGFIFVPSRRQVTAAQARSCIQAARCAASRPILAVGVFANAPVAEIHAVASEAGLDLIQLHGDEPPSVLEELMLPAIKALRPAPGTPPSEVKAAIAAYQRASRPPVAMLIDGYHPTHLGGGGIRADWALAAEVAAEATIVLAGGLDPVNVAEAIFAVRPAGVDVSSGVESHGVKDPAKIAAFIRAAKVAFESIRP